MSHPDASSQQTPAPAKSNRSALFIVFFVVFIDLLGFGIVLPLLPRFADTYVAELIPGGKTSGTGGLILGLLMASFSAMQLFFAPIWGGLSDRIGRRPILLIGLLGSVVFYALFGYALHIPAGSPRLALTLLFLCRIGQGIFGATIPTAQAVIADSTPPEKRKHGMALIGAAFGIGFTFGPLIAAGALRWWGDVPGAIGYVAAGLSLVALVLGVVLLPETRRQEAAPARRGWINLRNLVSVLRSPAIGPVVLTFFLATLGFGAFESTLSLINRDALRLADEDSFLLFAYVGFVLLLTQGFLYRRLANRLSEVAFMAIGIVLMGVGVVSLGWITWMGTTSAMAGSQTLILLTLGTVTFAVIGFAFLTPSAQALISRRADPARQGEILGANQSAAALARILGPAIGLPLYKLTATHLLPYLFGGGLLLLMLPLIPRIRHQEAG